MGKRSAFARVPRDAYDTPEAAVAPILRFLVPQVRFAEPCAGAGALVGHLERTGRRCVLARDVAPRGPGIATGDALALTADDLADAEVVVTNPPWERSFLHRFLAHVLALDVPTWLLLDAGWAYTRQAAPYLADCRMIVSVGRVRWIPGSAYTAKDDCAWYLFSRPLAPRCGADRFPLFVPRTEG